MKKIICKDIENNEHEVPTNKLFFRPSAYSVIIENDKVLLSKQWDGYDFPGGGIDIHETIEEALKRECWEETGLNIEIGDVVHCETSFFKLPSGDGFCNSILMYYICKRVGGKLSTDNFDKHEQEYADMPEWISLDEIDNIKFMNSIDSRQIIKKAIELIK